MKVLEVNEKETYTIKAKWLIHVSLFFIYFTSLKFHTLFKDFSKYIYIFSGDWFNIEIT